MAKRPNVGGKVQISGQIFTIVREPELIGKSFRILVENCEGNFYAAAEKWRGGRGPWKLELRIA